MAIVLAQGIDQLARVGTRGCQSQAAGKDLGWPARQSAGALDDRHGLAGAARASQHVTQRQQGKDVPRLLRQGLAQPGFRPAQ